MKEVRKNRSSPKGRMLALLSCLVCLALLVSACTASVSNPEVTSDETLAAVTDAEDLWTGDGPEPVFFDEFDGTELNLKKWARCPQWDRQGKSRWKDEMSYLDGEGHLILRMEWDEQEQIVNCGAVRTMGLFEYGYGYYEASVKFTPHRGAWCAFWMMVGDVTSVGNGATDGVEIDIFETPEGYLGKYTHYLHWDGYGKDLRSYQPKVKIDTNVFDGEFHAFGLLRSENGYYFYVDGKLSGIAPDTSRCKPCPLDGYIKLTCEAATWSGAGTPESIAELPGEMIVDYVRVYDPEHAPDLPLSFD